MAGKKPLTKNQIFTYLAEANNITKKDVAAFFDNLNNLAYKETKKNGKFTIPGFGILKLQKRKARMGRNPATGEAIKIPAKTVVKFTVSKVCKETICPPKKK
jgi:DNA-binding protein HU-beta